MKDKDKAPLLSKVYTLKLEEIKQELELDKYSDVIEKLIDVYLVKDEESLILVRKNISKRVSKGIGFTYAIEINALRYFCDMILKRIKYNK